VKASQGQAQQNFKVLRSVHSPRSWHAASWTLVVKTENAGHKELEVNPYRIMLADDQEIFRNGIRNVLCQQGDVQVCGEVCTIGECFQCIGETDPDLLILEIDLPKSSGIDILTGVKKDHQRIKVLILTNSKKRELIYLAVKNGADGFLLKEEPSRELLRAVEVIRNGGKFFSGLLSADLMSFISAKKPGATILTSREREVLQHLAAGMGSREIAASLDISVCTVNRHRYNIKKKLNLKHTSELIKYSIVNQYNL